MSRRIILSMLIITILMAIGYSRFASELDINGNAEIVGEWNVLITDVEVESVPTGCDAGTPTFTNTTLSFDAKLNKPGDEITYKVTVANKGTIDATLNNVIFTEGEGSDAINYTTTNLANDLAANEETSFLIIVTYEDVDIPPTDTTKSLTGMIEYVQK